MFDSRILKAHSKQWDQLDALMVPLLPQLGEEEIYMSGMRLLCAKIAFLGLDIVDVMILGKFVVIGF